MNQKDLSQSVLEKIKKEDIKPAPKWQFLAKDYAVWILSVLFLIVGSLAFSVIIYLIVNDDWDAYGQINESFGKFIILTMPYFWIIFLILFLLLADYNVAHTKKGYKYNIYTIIGIILIISIFSGIILYYIGVGNKIDDIFAKKVPFYDKHLLQKCDRWKHPEKGLLGGKIIEVKTPDNFQIEDQTGRIWKVINIDKIDKSVLIQEGTVIRMIGSVNDASTFTAEIILPTKPMHIRLFELRPCCTCKKNIKIQILQTI